MEKKLQNFKLYEDSSDMTGYYYNMLMSAMQVGVSKHLMDEYFTVIWANDYFYERTLYTKEEYEETFHNRCIDYFKQAPEEFEKFAKAIRDALMEGRDGYDSICRMPQKGGRHIWIKIVGKFTGESVNGIPVIYAVFTDVTEAVEQKELQKQLADRTEQLSAALDLAQAANREKSDFLSRMSHDIRTPMNAIMGMVDIALANMDNGEKVKDCLRKISLSSQHLLGLINDVLDMSKIESGKMTLSDSEMSLPETTENIVSIMQPNVKAMNQRFDIHICNVKHEHFYCDSLRLRQIMINLLSNATKFTPMNGRILFEIEECPSDTPGIAMIKFRVSDSGIGIQREFQEHLFEPFSREKDSRVDKTEGSGLGMAITKKIVDLMGGTIAVFSQPGEGTTFEVMLPLKIYVRDPGSGQFPDMKILVVDDDETICEYTVQMLNSLGVRAECETSGIDAEHRIEKAHAEGGDYDAVILDWKMPGQNGLDTARHIREKVGSDFPILLISSYDWTEIKHDALASGINGFIMKPIFKSTLCNVLQKHVLKHFPAGNPGSSGIDLKNKRILLVEDNELNREIAIEFLNSTGARTEFACNGLEGAEKFGQSPQGYYDLILMDIQMPVMNGYEASRAIRAMEREDARSVLILAMTADAFTEDVIEAQKAGMNGHLAKPLDRLTLFRKLENYIN